MSWLLLGLAMLVGMAGVSETAVEAARPRARQGIPGAPVYAGSEWRSGINYSGFVAQVGTIVVTTATDSATYTFTLGFNGYTKTFAVVNGTSSTTTTVATLLAATINAEPTIRGWVTATSLTTTVTITANRAGTAGAFTLTESDSKITGTESATAAADGAVMGYGLAVVRNGSVAAATGAPLAGTERLITIPSTSVFSAQVVTATIVNGVATNRKVRVWEVRGVGDRTLLVETEFAGSATEATEATNIAAAVELAAPANTVAAAVVASVTVTFTAEIKGTEIAVEIEQVNAGDITFANTTGPDRTTSLAQAFLGISKFASDREAATLTSVTGSYAAQSVARYTRRGVVWVTSAQSPGEGDIVYVELAPGSTLGRFYTDSSSTRVALSRQVARWARDGQVTNDNLAAIQLGA